jgi:hypothetical protein
MLVDVVKVVKYCYKFIFGGTGKTLEKSVTLAGKHDRHFLLHVLQIAMNRESEILSPCYLRDGVIFKFALSNLRCNNIECTSELEYFLIVDWAMTLTCNFQ